MQIMLLVWICYPSFHVNTIALHLYEYILQTLVTRHYPNASHILTRTS